MSRPTRPEVWAKATLIQERYARTGKLISRNRAIKLARGFKPATPKKKKPRRRKFSIFAPTLFDSSKCLTKAQRVSALRRLADAHVNNPVPPDQIRAEFIAARLTRPNPKNSVCAVCRSSAADCFHHIIQVQNGGSNDRSNLLPVCDPCHGRIHPWLTNTPTNKVSGLAPGPLAASKPFAGHPWAGPANTPDATQIAPHANVVTIPAPVLRPSSQSPRNHPYSGPSSRRVRVRP